MCEQDQAHAGKKTAALLKHLLQAVLNAPARLTIPATIVAIGLYLAQLLASPWQLLVPMVTIVAFGATILAEGMSDARKAVRIFRADRKLRLTSDISMGIALIGSIVLGELLTALVIVIATHIGRAIHDRIEGRETDSLRGLLELVPDIAILIDEGGRHNKVPTDTLKPGDIVLVPAGERLAVDGVVVEGCSQVNESTLTGESALIDKEPGSNVSAGTTNSGRGFLKVETVRVGNETAAGKIVRLVLEAKQHPSPIQETADWFATCLVCMGSFGAMVAFLVTLNVYAALSVLIVCGACGIFVGTQIGIFGGVGRAARLGVLIKSGKYLQLLAEVNTLVFDKTGTLTQGDPECVEVIPEAGCSEDLLLRVAATAEKFSGHRLAQAIVAAATKRSLDLPDPSTHRELVGEGIVCQYDGCEIVVGNQQLASRYLVGDQLSRLTTYGASSGDRSQIFVVCDGVFFGTIHVRDRIRAESARAIAQLKELGLKIWVLSGDEHSVVERVAEELGIKYCQGGLTPEDKARAVRTMMDEGMLVGMVGDGVNDALALTTATLGVAIGSGTNIAVESADVVLVGDNLLNLVEVIRTARRCQRVIGYNFRGTVAVDIIGVLLAALGIINPVAAVLIHVGTELSCILNSARLLPRS